MTGPQNVEMGHDPDHALSEMIYHWQSATYYGQHTHTLCLKFEISICACYRDMKGSAKCRKWGGFGWLGVTEGYGQCHLSTEGSTYVFY